MKAVILAAGAGTRMQRYAVPKPLLQLLGLRLVERVLLACRAAGIRDFVLVVGHQGRRIRSALGDGARWGVHIEYVENPDWPRGNATSVLAAEAAVGNAPFLLCMSDHLMDPEVPRRLLRTPLPPGQVLVAVDRDLDGPHVDVSEASKVRLQDGRVTAVGKGLAQADAVEMGTFLCSPEVFPQVRACIDHGHTELTAVMDELARQGRCRAVDMTGLFWIDVDDPVMLRRARTLLLKRLIKPSDGPVSRWLNRKISLWISARLASMRTFTPNLMTLLVFLISLSGSLLLLVNQRLHDILAAFLIQLASILDGCDGELARLRFQTSSFGAWLDRVLDRYSDGLLIMVLTYRVSLTTPGEWVWILGGATLLGVLVSSYLAIPYDASLARRGAAIWRLGRDVRLFLVFLGVLLGRFLEVLWLLAFLGHFEVLRRLLHVRRVPQSAA